MTDTEAVEPATVQIDAQDYIDSLKRQLSEQAASHADAVAQRDGVIAKLSRDLRASQEMIDQLGSKNGSGK